MPQKNPHIPERTCVACRKKAPKADFIRVIRTPKGTLKIAQSENEPGRGIYLCPTKKCFNQAIKRKGQTPFQYQLKVKPTEEFIAELKKKCQP